MTAAVRHPLTGAEAAHICCQLHRDGIDVGTAKIAGIVHVWPRHPVTTLQEVAALTPFLKRTDGRISWHREAP